MDQKEKNLPEQENLTEAVETPVEVPAEEPIEAPVEEPVEEPVEAPEEVPVEEPVKEPSRPAVKKSGLRVNKLKRGGMATLLSVVFIAIVVVVNILVSLLTERFPSLDMDLTAQKIHSLSEQATAIAEKVEQDTTIYLIGQEESYRKNRFYSSYGLEYSQVAILAEKLREANPKIGVQFIDPDTNPGFISQYAGENLTSGTVVVKTDKRYKVLYVTDLFSVVQNQSTYRTETYSKVDSALAGALELVNMDSVPLIAVASGHGELTLNGTLNAFSQMMENQNFELREINFLTDEIPEETQVLMIATPTSDYTTEEVERIRAFLNDKTSGKDRTMLVTFHSNQGRLPNLENFLEEWGIRVEPGLVMESDASRMLAAYPSYILVDANQKELLAGNTYNNLVSAASRPLTIVFEGNGDYSTEPMWISSDSSYILHEDDETLPEDPETGSHTVAALGTKFAKVDGVSARRSVLVFGSTFVFTDNFINAPAYGDSAYIRDVLQFATGTDASQVTVRDKSVQTHVLDVTMPQSTVSLLGLGVFTVGIPLVIVIAGLVIFLKRRHL